MRVALSVGGRFHAFDLAQQLHKRGYLTRLLTSYPKYKLQSWGIPKSKIKAFTFKEIVSRLHDRLPKRLQWEDMKYWPNEWFDRMASRNLPDVDICTAWSGHGLHTIRRAKAQGALTFIERNSSHIEFQRDILCQEYANYGVNRPPVNQRALEKELLEYNEADYIVVPSTFAERTFIQKGVRQEKLLRIPFGVRLKDFYPIEKEDTTFRVINVGAQSLRKGTPYLLEAFTQLRLPNTELLLVGDIEDDVRNHIRTRPHNVRHVPSVPQHVLVQYYRQASVFVTCSVEDGFGMVQAQAMACGLPVICTSNTGAADLVRDGLDGFILPIRDIESLKEKWLYLYEHPELRIAMGESALKRVQRGFSWDEYGTRVVEAYEERLRRHDATAPIS